MAGLGSEGAREGKEGSKPYDYGGFMWGVSDSASTRVYTNVLVVYEHLGVFPEW